MTMTRALDELNSLLSKSPLHSSDIINILSQIRVLFDEHTLQNKYQALNLYCNWTFHYKISHSIVCYRILEQLTDILMQHDEGKPEVITEVTNVLLTQELRQDFIKFCSHFKLPTIHFTEQSNWTGIWGLIIRNLIGRPLEFPNIEEILEKKRLLRSDKKMMSIYDSIQSKSKGTNLAVKRFSFFLPTPEILNKDDYIKSYKNALLWKIETNLDYVSIVSPVIFMGRKIAFHE